ncbi:hypothetical protein MHEI_18820 [Mycobacterium heidelbergense]|nr:hypothetical protein MHEI_18820 [Mycobacterium heidelbergense]
MSGESAGDQFPTVDAAISVHGRLRSLDIGTCRSFSAGGDERKGTRAAATGTVRKGLPKFQISPPELFGSPRVASKDGIRRASALPGHNVAGLRFRGYLEAEVVTNDRHPSMS